MKLNTGVHLHDLHDLHLSMYFPYLLTIIIIINYNSYIYISNRVKPIPVRFSFTYRHVNPCKWIQKNKFLNFI